MPRPRSCGARSAPTVKAGASLPVGAHRRPALRRFAGGSGRWPRCRVDLPVLRKDFTVCDNDVVDARLMGADAVLLIVAALDDAELRRPRRTGRRARPRCAGRGPRRGGGRSCAYNTPGESMIGVNQRRPRHLRGRPGPGGAGGRTNPDRDDQGRRVGGARSRGCTGTARSRLRRGAGRRAPGHRRGSWCCPDRSTGPTG